MELALNFLPPGGLTSSVVTTVWVGIMVVVFFNLRFGTTLSGLVVPGYLIPLFIVHPASGWVILAESALTYAIARLVAERGLVRLGLGEMFGRDRFFILILISVLVRILSDAFILPALAQQLADWGAPYELRSGLHSFGLIIIALCANQLWNGGIKVGALTLALYLLVTYAIVTLLLMPYTNFNISTLSYMYEDIASSILASPKAYIILITAAFVSSRMNLRYGWDFNGILIPSLLALQWYDPFKILATFIEAVAILLGSTVLLRSWPFKQMNMEGSRQLLLFFNVGFFYKLLIGYAIINLIPGQKVTDFYGFGYVLGTLMALKMYQKGIAIRFTRTTLQTSLVAIVSASLLGFVLTLSSSDDGHITPLPGQQELHISASSLGQFVADSRSLTYKSQSARAQLPLSGFDVTAYTRLFKQLGKLRENTQLAQLNAIASQAHQLGFDSHWLEQRYLALVESNTENGRGFYIVDSQAPGDLAIQVPHALDEPNAAAAAYHVYHALGARYLAFSGARAKRAQDGSDDVLLNSQSVFQLFHQALSNNSAVQLRRYTARSVRQLFGVRKQQQALSLKVQKTSLWVKRNLPQSLALQPLKTLLGELDLHWQAAPNQNRQRDTAITGFVEIYLNEQSLLNIYAQTASKQAYTLVNQDQRIDGYLQSFLLEHKLNFAAKNSQVYVLADKYQLLYFDQAILQPVLRLIDQLAQQPWNSAYQSRLNQISLQATQFGYQVMLYRHIPSQAEYIIFKEHNDSPRYWGTYALKLGPSSNYIIEVPMPRVEQNTLEFATSVFQNLAAKAILISATHPQANSDGSAQLTSSLHIDSLFNLFHQSLLRHYAQLAPVAVQVRGFNPAPDEDPSKLVLAHFEHAKPGAKNHPGLIKLKAHLQQNGFELRQADPSQVHQRFQARLNAQSRFTKYISDAHYAEIWLPQKLRYQLNRAQQDDSLARKIAALQLEVLHVDILHWLSQQSYINAAPFLYQRLLPGLEQFKISQNISQLRLIGQTGPVIKLLLDNNTQTYYLVALTQLNQLYLVASLAPLQQEKLHFGNEQGPSAKQIARFIDNRHSYLLGSRAP